MGEADLGAGDSACAQGAPSEGALRKRAERARRRAQARDYERKIAAVQRLCRRLEGGGTVADACREPGMPSRSTLMYWLATDAELRGMAEAAEAAGAAVFGPRRAYVGYDPEVAAELLERLAHGRSLAEVCEERDMPTCATVHRWREAHPEFQAAYLKAREAQAERLFDLAWRIACEAGEDEVKTARLKIHTIWRRIAKLAPRAFGTHRATEAPAAAGTEAEPERTIVSFVPRRFGRTPEGAMVEITDLIRGLPAAEADALRRDLREGRVRPEDLAPAPAWMGSRIQDDAARVKLSGR
ncbi:MAG: hypothetical protein JNK30_15265 [Phenylobacterium sp.]|uniref:terminase small subunit-like protein n=1 Tax=Phenylobacterium sp. TaxID=1871053 RepID=UPI001A36DA31|nr:hypothetical protein [Phenylobacterium sp.]MBL8772741.1 hypothetical protein [Phenylobacterium sp.]